MDCTVTKSVKSENSWYGGGVFHRWMKLPWVFRDAAESGEPRTAWGTPGGLCWVRLHGEGQGQTRVCPETAASWATENVPTLEEDLSFSKFLKVPLEEKGAKSENTSKC